MGYDMSWRKEAGEAEKLAVKAAQEVFSEACDRRDALPREARGDFIGGEARQARGLDFEAHEAWPGRTPEYIAAVDAAHEAYRAMYAAEKSYFRIGQFSMGRWVDVMLDIGMAFDDEEPPPWPQIEAYGTNWDHVEAVRYPDADAEPLDAEARERAERYQAECDRVLSWHGKTDTPGIPAHKFSSNDGWIVLPAECQAALKIYAAKLEEIGPEAMGNLLVNTIGEGAVRRFNDWLDFIAGASKHDGFEVS